MVGGAVAVADPGSSGSAAHGDDGTNASGRQPSTGAKNHKKSLGGTDTKDGALGSSRQPGRQYFTAAKRPNDEPGGMGPVTTGLAIGDGAGPAGMSPLAANPALDAAVSGATFTGDPSLVSRGFVAGLRLINPVLRLAGIELNGFSATIPFITDGIPPFFLTCGSDVKSEEYAGWKVWTLTPAEPSGQVVVAIHGGSFISQASILHWWTYADMARDTGATVIVPLYPLANGEEPGHRRDGGAHHGGLHCGPGRRSRARGRPACQCCRRLRRWCDCAGRHPGIGASMRHGPRL